MKYLLCTNLADYDELRIAQCLAAMPPSEIQRIQRTRNPKGRREKVIAYQLLTDCLRQEGLLHEPPLLNYGCHDKPKLSNYPDVHFNISHCANAVAVAIDSNEIGIDVESIRPYKEELSQRVFSPREQHLISLADDKARIFSQLWTRKEAVVKCLGTGIVGMESLRAIDVSDDTIILPRHNTLHLTTIPLPNDKGYLTLCQPA